MFPMKRPFFRRLLPPGLALLLLPAALAQSPATAPQQDEARLLLERVAQTYTDLDRFFFEALEKTETVSQDFEQTTETRYVTAIDADGRARFGMFSRGNEGVAVFDGSATWMYSPRLKQYTRRSEDPFAAARGENGAPRLDPRKSARRYTQRYAGAVTRLREARVVPDPDRPAGTQVTIEAVYDTPPGVAHGRLWRKYWIDRNVGLVLREVSTASMRKPDMKNPIKVRQTIRFRTAVVGDAVPVETFTFEPPPDAELVEQFGATSSLVSKLEGQPAPDFALRDFSGKTYRLEELAGKVVLLDFWATWCKPCRIDLPHVEALAEEFGDQGLVVLGVNAEPERRSRPFFEQQGYRFPSLVDRGARVSQRYFVGSLPTLVIIDRESKIASYLVGLQPDEHLRAELAKVGIR